MPFPALLARVRPFAIRILLVVVRPLLLLHFVVYSHTVQHSAFPRDLAERSHPGADPVRLLFVGDVAVAGYGVLREGMALPAQTALHVSQANRRGVDWENVGGFDFSARTAVRAVRGHASGVDVAVVALGIPDVLLVTSSRVWRRNLRRLIDVIRTESDPGTRILLAGPPPMHRFQPLPTVAGRAITAQLRRLDRVMEELAAEIDGVSFAAFPDLRLDSMFMKDAFSFRAMHRIWAQELALHVERAARLREGHELAA
ncbi:hypothetical protein AS850_14775 [Frondihabitans sp. 762G35]|uniref:SGNH/GDSL hydrolase family protein n=1 Tax=Frondihabitans sp. 762G35 TaxID=1446794 RepID=UPI000D213256|nr:SGNH/GDSL hydrolase family protein [Frondihabitans sp. 762G35]ARC58347.1 hypothetical protein AS850_14775 [Frondihabitans sp. 762G35]